MADVRILPWARAPRVARRGVGLGACITSGGAATLVLVMAATAMGSESPSPATPPSVLVRVHWVDRDRSFSGEGKALELTGDSLLFDRFAMRREGFEYMRDDEVGRIRVYLPNMNGIQVSRGSHGHAGQGAIIGGVIGVVLGALAIASYTPSDSFVGPSDSQFRTGAVIGGAAFGALCGAGIGALARTEQWEPVGREELRRLLTYGPVTTPKSR